MHIAVQIELTTIEDVVALAAVLRDKLDPMTPLQADSVRMELKGQTDALAAGLSADQR